MPDQTHQNVQQATVDMGTTTNDVRPDVEHVAGLTAEADGEPFSIYSTRQKRLMVILAAFAAFFSPVTASIYLPALNSLAEDLHVSTGKITLTITFYLILQGIAPTFIGGFSDSAGRRPAYIICFVIYNIANVALALQRNYVALLVLRMVQSTGSSGTVALANAVVADLVTSAERGSYIAWTSVTAILAPSLGPVIGGLLSQYAGWHWIFWFLFILSMVFFIPFLLFMPETSRVIVGNGRIPPSMINQSLPTYLRERRLKREGNTDVFSERDELARGRKLRFPSPMGTLRILFTKTAGLILLSSSLLFATYYLVTAALPAQFKQRYGLSDIQISLLYLPLGVGTTLSAFTTGPLIDWNYKRHAKKVGIIVDKNRQDDLSNFPVERARIEISAPIGAIGCFSVIGYGWMLEAKVAIAGPCIMLFVFAFSMTALFNTMNILMVDIHQGKPASATAANNLTRCLLGAAFTAAVTPLDNTIGPGWTCTLAAGIWGGFSFPMLLWLVLAGPRWRREAKEQSRLKEEGKNARAATIEQVNLGATARADIDTAQSEKSGLSR